MSKFKLNRKIQRIVEQIQKNEGIIPDISLEEFILNKNKCLYTTIAKNNEGKKILFRCSLNDFFYNQVNKEINIYNIAKENKINYFPKLLKYGEYKGIKWLTYRFIYGQMVGNVYQFNKNFNYDLIIDFLHKKKKIPNKKISSVLQLMDKARYNKLFDCIIKEKEYLLDKLLSEARDKVINYINKIKYLCLTHGDLQPRNIISKSNNIRIIDWEDCYLTSAAYDYSFIWARCYNKVVRKRLWKDLITNYPGIDQEAVIIFVFNLFRDYFEWHSVKENKSILLKPSEVINGAKINDIILDLYDQIKFFSKVI